MSKFPTQYDLDFTAFAGEENSGEVLVEPEKCLSIKEIAERFCQGYDISEFRTNLDEGEPLNDDDIDNIDNPQYDAEFAEYYDAMERSNYFGRREPSVSQQSGDNDERAKDNAGGNFSKEQEKEVKKDID